MPRIDHSLQSNDPITVRAIPGDDASENIFQVIDSSGGVIFSLPDDTVPTTYDVTDYGAVGNGSTDDTAAIQEAIDAADAAGGGIVWFPLPPVSGNPYYLVNGTLNLDDMENIRLVGEVSGGGAFSNGSGVILVRGSGSATMISWQLVGGSQSLRGNGISNLSLQCNSLVGTAILLGDQEAGMWENVWIANATSVCLDLTTSGIGTTGFQDNVFMNWRITCYSTSAIGMRWRSFSTGSPNVSFNTFHTFRIFHGDGTGLDAGDSDSNYCYGFGIGTAGGKTGVGLVLHGSSTAGSGHCRSNTFIGFQTSSGITAKATGLTQASANNFFIGNRENGGVAPTVETGATITWIDNNGQVSLGDYFFNNETTDTQLVYAAATMYNPPAASKTTFGQRIIFSGRGTATVTQRGAGLGVLMQDSSAVAAVSVTNVVNNGSGLFRVTAASHGLATSDKAIIYGVTGATAANGAWVVTRINANTVDLQGSVFAGAYVSGGTLTNRPMMTGVEVSVSPRLARGNMGSLVGTAANADDFNGMVVQNASGTSGYKATDAFYVSAGGPTVGAAWDHGFACDAKVAVAGFQYTGDLTGSAAEGSNAAMLDLGSATASAGGSAIRLPNNVPSVARNAANSADFQLFYADTSNALQFAPPVKFADSLTIADGKHINFDTSNGTKLGTSTSQKIGFWNVTPVAQQVLATGTGKTVDNVITLLQTLGLCRQS